MAQRTPLQTTSGTGFTGAPYSGRETTITEKTLTDGTTTSQTFVTLNWRDDEGRTRREMIRHTASGREYQSVLVTDPVAGVYLKWTAGDDTVQHVVHIWPGPKGTAPIASNPTPSPKAPPAPSPEGLVRENLPAQTINGVSAEGTRTTRTIRLDEESTNRVIQVVNEIWISPDLKLIVRHISIDPRTGKTTTELTDVVKEIQNPALFRAPDGYSVVDHRVKDRP